MRRRSRTPMSRHRWILAAAGLVVLLGALVPAASPYRQTRDFHRTMTCGARPGDCLPVEKGTIRARRTYTTTSSQGDQTTTTTHWEVTWERPGGALQRRDTSTDFYRHAEPGAPADLRIWRGAVVGVEVRDAAEWFLPASGGSLAWWLHLAWLGLGLTLWALLAGWWDGWFMLAFRTFAWTFLSILPVRLGTHALAYGPETGTALLGMLALVAVFATVGVALLWGSLRR